LPTAKTLKPYRLIKDFGHVVEIGGKPFLKKRVRAAQAKIPQTPIPKNF